MIVFVNVNSIVVPPDRQRKEFDADAMMELQESIQEIGMLSPIILGDNTELIAGERRLRAAKDIYMMGGKIPFMNGFAPEGTIPCVTLNDLPEYIRMEIEYDENCKRSDLTWQERAAATSKLQQIRQKQAELTGTPPPTATSLAEEISGKQDARGYPVDKVQKELIVSKHLDDPDVAKASNVQDAFKILRKKEEAKKYEELGKSVGATYTSAVHKAVHGDSLSWMHECPADYFDVILTDPPYGMGADEFGDSNQAEMGNHSYKDDFSTFSNIIKGLAVESFRIAKAQSHLYMFCDIGNFPFAKCVFEDAGWTVFRTPLIYHKPNAFRAPWPDKGPQRQYEAILYAVKGGKLVTALYSDVLIQRPDSQLNHPAQKPVGLYYDLLRRSTKPGDKVLDPFMGTGPIFPAAHMLKCVATGIELDEAYYGTAVKRIQEL